MLALSPPPIGFGIIRIMMALVNVLRILSLLILSAYAEACTYSAVLINREKATMILSLKWQRKLADCVIKSTSLLFQS